MEALIDPRLEGDLGPKRRGDVLEVGPDGTSWNARERKIFQVVEWPIEDAQDREVAALIQEMIDAGSLRPVAGNPYMNKEPVEIGKEGLHVTDRSTKYVDLDALPPLLRARVMDPTQEVPKLRRDQYNLRKRAVTATRTGSGLLRGFL